MAKFTLGTPEAEHYVQAKQSGGFFALKNDGDSARVRFLYDDGGQIPGYVVHQVEVNGKNRYVNCLRNHPEDPVHMCPFCASGKPQITKLFLQVYNLDANEVQVWDRGQGFIRNVQHLIKRHPKIVTALFEITRIGKPRDPNTKYEIDFLEKDETLTTESLPKGQDPLGTLVLLKSAAEMDFYNKYNYFEEADVERRPTASAPQGYTPQNQAPQGYASQDQVAPQATGDENIPFNSAPQSETVRRTPGSTLGDNTF